MPSSMSKTTNSQWDFGELFPREETRRVFSVSQLTSQVRRLLEQHIGSIWVTGEITNLRVQTSGHMYFTIKDAVSQLQCVLFAGDAVEGDRSSLRDGQKVVLRGDLTVYEARGQYQLRVTAIELQGVGALQIAFEKLKQKLHAEGLFSTERKRPLPRFPRRIGLVTSPTGAAIRDVLHVIQRRNPSLEIILTPCKVQGDGAAFEIASSIRLLNQFAEQSQLDLILLTRGGGSLEDLWAFNEEIVARAIFQSNVPVISAIGHEIDFTISDFVADFRAPTPSVGAEIITEGVFSSCRFLAETATWLTQQVRARLDREKRQLQQWDNRLARCHPSRRLDEKRQHLDELFVSLSRCVRHDWKKHFADWQNLQNRLSRVHPSRLFKQRKEVFEQANERLKEQLRHKLERIKGRCESLDTRLRLLSPEQILARGYSITMDADTGELLRSASDALPGQKLKTKLQAGEIRSTVDKQS